MIAGGDARANASRGRGRPRYKGPDCCSVGVPARDLVPLLTQDASGDEEFFDFCKWLNLLRNRPEYRRTLLPVLQRKNRRRDACYHNAHRTFVLHKQQRAAIFPKPHFVLLLPDGNPVSHAFHRRGSTHGISVGGWVAGRWVGLFAAELHEAIQPTEARVPAGGW